MVPSVMLAVAAEVIVGAVLSKVKAPDNTL